MKPTTEKYQCLNRLCGKFYKHTSQPHRQEANEVSDSDITGYTLGHSCSFCGSEYVKWLNFETDWICNEETGWNWQKKVINP